MSLRINSNIGAMNSHRNISMTDLKISKSLEKLSSGLRINHAADDAAGLEMANRLLAQVNGLNQAQSNAQQGINLINVADGALDQIGQMLQRMRELAVESANGTMTTSDRASANQEVNQLLSEVDNIASYTTFNGYTLLNAATTTFTFQVGANKNETMAVAVSGTSTGGLTLSGMVVDSQTNAVAALVSLDSAIQAVDDLRAKLGASSNRLQYEINNISISAQNMKAAESQIRDVDMASEMSNLTTQQILMQSGTAMLAQANAQPQTLLTLFK